MIVGKKELFIVILILIFLIGFERIQNEKQENIDLNLNENKFDYIKISACEEADKARTCQTRLIEVGIITPNECCEAVGRCCGE